MAKLSSIARPYALAAFEYAREKQQLPAWKIFLEATADSVKQLIARKWLTNPESSVKLSELLLEGLAPILTTEQKNFLLLVKQNKRFSALPEIADQFNHYYTALQKVSAIRVVTAIEAQKDFQAKLTQALTKRIQHEVTINYEIDAAIIGGAIIHIGDRVIDGSVRGKLTRLLQSLTE
ncbi:MAG: F0F1 ATP synthase subunit delta [Gammaproteobacteria bacterium]|nr:F0F1 ATP synthase subunit delta [Gammaproteobacteria bacterium]